LESEKHEFEFCKEGTPNFSMQLERGGRASFLTLVEWNMPRPLDALRYAAGIGA
jgi:hypothetical protein